MPGMGRMEQAHHSAVLEEPCEEWPLSIQDLIITPGTNIVKEKGLVLTWGSGLNALNKT